jgi:two-component system, NtrC family, response regulator HydG
VSDIDIRLISATNMPIHEMSKTNEFRQDLLYRINTIEITLPPLRSRKEDIPLLARYYLNQYSARYKKKVENVSKEGIAKLAGYDWPGNIRELQHAVERAVIMADTETLHAGDFLLHSNTGAGNEPDFEQFSLEELERTAVEKALKRNAGNISKAAEDLGLTRASLYRRMEKYGL